MLKHFFLGVCWLFSCAFLTAQTTLDLRVHYKFDGTLNDEYSNSTAVSQDGTAEFGCGVRGNALRLSGNPGEGILIFGQEVNNLFKISDFTLSFYFKSTAFNQTRDIIAKRLECDQDSSFAIRYSPASATVVAEVSESANKSASTQYPLDAAQCWHHITVVRDHTRTLLYVDGLFVKQSSIATVINITNDAPLTLAAGPCLATTDEPFKGYIDDLRIYGRALKNDEVVQLYDRPDHIATRDTIVYINDVINVELTNTCAFNFIWTPNTYLNNEFAAEPVITLPDAGEFEYVVLMDDDECVAYDTLRVKVIDPATLDCKEIYLPNAFTPNTDIHNPVFGISNAIVVQDLISFEIYDRWGNRVFKALDAFDTWDATYNGQPVNPAVFLYVVKYRCNGEEFTKSGSVTVIR